MSGGLAQARPVAQRGRNTEYTTMLSRHDSNPPALNLSLASPTNPLNQPIVNNPLRSPGRRMPQADDCEYDVMPKQP